jgi:hypothetical protein
MRPPLADDFNPYGRWLALALDGPPNYYELLSLPPTETDDRQIIIAAEQAATKVRSFRPGPHARAWSQLLDEIQAARECLCDPARRSEYDAELVRGQTSHYTPLAVVDNAPPSVLAAVSSELYPLGMVRPASPPEEVPPQFAVVTQLRPRSDLDPPQRPTSAPEEAPQAESSEAPTLPLSAMPLPTPSAEALPASVDPMAPVLVEALLPPGAEAAPVAAAESPFAVSAAPTAAQFATQQARQAQWLLILAGLGGMALIAGTAVAYVVMTRPAAPGRNALAERPTAPVPAAAPQTRPQPTDDAPVRPTMLLPTAAPTADPTTPTVAPVEARPTPTPTFPSTPPTAAPAPSPPEQPVPKVTRSEVQALIKALDAAKAAIGEQNFKAADLQIAKAESLAKLPKHKGAVARLKEAGGYVKQFRQALAAGAGGMQAGESFKVGNSTQVSFVEAGSDKVVVRIAGNNRTYSFSDMPAGLAFAFADLKLPASDPATRVIKGAYLLTQKRADIESQEKAKSLWAEAQAAGADIRHLMPLLTDNYADLLKDAPAS